MKVFLAGTVKSLGNRRFLETIADLLEGTGYEVFLPHRDGNIQGKSGQEKGLVTRDDLADNFGRKVFEGNLNIINASDVCVAVLDGLCWGTSVELGYAYAYQKFVKPSLRIIGLYTDPIQELDITRFYACDYVANDLPQLLARLNAVQEPSDPI